MNIRKAVIPAAGVGARLWPVTNAIPKEMFPIVDKPTMQYIVDEAREAGITDILIITRDNKYSIENYFGQEYCGINIYYARQDRPEGLASAVYLAKTFVGNEPFAVLLGDVVTHYISGHAFLKEMVDSFNVNNGNMIGLKEVDFSEVSKYGIVQRSVYDFVADTHRVCDLVEKPSQKEAQSNNAIVGRYIFTPDIFGAIEELFTIESTGEYQLTDAIKLLMNKNHVYTKTYCGDVYDLGSRIGFLQANIDFAMMRDELKNDVLKYLKKGGYITSAMRV